MSCNIHGDIPCKCLGIKPFSGEISSPLSDILNDQRRKMRKDEKESFLDNLCDNFEEIFG